MKGYNATPWNNLKITQSCRWQNVNLATHGLEVWCIWSEFNTLMTKSKNHLWRPPCQRIHVCMILTWPFCATSNVSALIQYLPVYCGSVVSIQKSYRSPLEITRESTWKMKIMKYFSCCQDMYMYRSHGWRSRLSRAVRIGNPSLSFLYLVRYSDAHLGPVGPHFRSIRSIWVQVVHWGPPGRLGSTWFLVTFCLSGFWLQEFWRENWSLHQVAGLYALWGLILEGSSGHHGFLQSTTVFVVFGIISIWALIVGQN